MTAVTRRADRIVLGGLALLPFVWFFTPIFTDSSYFLGDLIAQYAPWWTWGHESLLEGRFPLWNPWVLGGMPYHVNPENALFYPLKLPLVFLPFFKAAALLRALNAVVACTGAYALLRAWRARPVSGVLGAIMFGYGSFMAYEFVHIPYVSTAVWFPWQLLFLERLLRRPGPRSAGWLAVATATSFLGGSPGIFLIVQLTLGFFLAARVLRLALARRWSRLARAAGWLGAAVALAVGLTLVLLWPAWEFVGMTPRSGGLGASPTYDEFAMGAEVLRTLVFPWRHAVHGAPYPPVYPIPYLYVPYAGAGAVLLALFGLRSRRGAMLMPVALSVGAFGVLMALGPRGAFFPWMLGHIPAFRWFRWPHDYLLMVYLVLWIAAAAGFDALWRCRGARLRTFGPLAAIYAVAGTVLAPGTGAWIFAAILGGVAGLLFLFRSAERSSGWRSVLGVAAIALVAADLFAWSYGLRTYLPASALRMEPMRAAIARVRLEDPIARVAVSAPAAGAYFMGRERVFSRHVPLVETIPPENLAATDFDRWLRRANPGDLDAWLWRRRASFHDLDDVHWAYPVNASMILRYQEIAGYDPFAIDRVLRLFRTLPVWRTWDLFGVAWVVTSHRVVHERLAPVGETSGLHLYRNRTVLPRVTVPRRVVPGLDAARVLERMRDPSFDPRNEALLEDTPPAGMIDAALLGGAGVPPGTAKIVEYEPERVTVAAEMLRPGFVVLHDVYHPGWRVRVDDEEAPLHRANYVFRAVRVPAGPHRIEFVYHPASFFIGAWISGLCWAGVLLAGIVAALRARRMP